MAAEFPTGIASFKVNGRRHRNLLDDVDAAHINKLEDEVVAIESSLGPLLLDFEELEADVEENQELDEQQNKKIRRFQTRFKSMKDRLEYLTRGENILFTQLMRQGNLFVNEANTIGNPPPTVQFPKPSRERDPRRQYNGRGLTLRQGGLWLIRGHIRYDLSGDPINGAIYQAGIKINGDHWAHGVHRQRLEDNRFNADVFLNPVSLSVLPRGSQVNLATSWVQLGGQLQGTKKVVQASIAAVRLRGL